MKKILQESFLISDRFPPGGGHMEKWNKPNLLFWNLVEGL